MKDYLEKYGYSLSREEIEKFVNTVHDNIKHWSTPQILSDCLGMIDLTSLKPTDTHNKIASMVHKVNNFKKSFPDYPYPASICIYPNFSKTIKDNLSAEGVHITSVSGCFPASQSYIEVKCLESRLAVENGANEIDIVLALNAFLAKDYQTCIDEIRAIKESIGDAHLKVILETGAIDNPDDIARASFLAMEAGADFIKTSTGKMEPAATPMAAIVMCSCIKLFYQATGRKIGFKPAGGISTAKDASSYYGIVDSILGKEWLCPALFRFGASRMANNILSELKQETIVYY